MADNKYKLRLYLSNGTSVDVEGEIVAPQGPQGPAGEGASIIVDSAWIEGSTNPVESKLIKEELDALQSLINNMENLAPTFLSFSASIEPMTGGSYTDEQGNLVRWFNIEGSTTFIIHYIYYRLANYDRIQSRNLEVHKNGEYLKTVQVLQSIDYITLEDTEVITQNKQIIYTVKGESESGLAFSKSLICQFYFPIYYGSSYNAMLERISGLNKTYEKDITLTISDEVQYMYFASTEDIKSVIYEGFFVTLIQLDDEIVDGVTYHVYRTPNRLVPSEYTVTLE